MGSGWNFHRVENTYRVLQGVSPERQTSACKMCIQISKIHRKHSIKLLLLLLFVFARLFFLFEFLRGICWFSDKQDVRGKYLALRHDLTCEVECLCSATWLTGSGNRSKESIRHAVVVVVLSQPLCRVIFQCAFT